MVSFAYLLVVLSVFSAAVLAEDVKSSQTESVDEKWWNYGSRWNSWASLGYYNYAYGCNYDWLNRYGNFGAYGLLQLNSWPSAWFKEVSNSASSARRSISTKADDHLYRRDESTVACKNTQGQTDHYALADCRQAVQALVSKKTSAANCKSCAVKLVTPNGQLAAAGVPAEALQKVAGQILKSCAAGAGASSNHARRSPSDSPASGTTKQQFAMIIQKGDGAGCDA